MERVREDHFFFESDGRRLYGFLHMPAGREEEPGAGLVFLDPWGEEKVRNHRLMVNLARDLARAGHPVLRFDFHGYGDSAGEFEEAELRTMVDDTLAACRLLRERSGSRRIGLLGPRFGGAVALETALTGRAVDFLILLDPILDVHAYFYKLLRSNLTSQLLVHDKVVRDRDQLVDDLEHGGAVNIDGYLLGSSFYRSVRHLNYFDDSRLDRRLPPSLLLEASVRESGASQKLGRFMERRGLSGLPMEFMPLDLPVYWEGQKSYQPHAVALREAIGGWLPRILGEPAPAAQEI